jgi:polar amino acid transport system substrate-binding protein
MNRPKTTRRRPRVLVVATLICTLLLAAVGCSSSDSANQTSANAPTGEKDAALAAMVPESIQQRRFLDVVSANYPPATIASSQGAEPTGWDVETVRAIAATLGLEARFRIVPFDSIVPGLQAGRYQAAIGEIFVTPERTAVVTFVQNHVTTDSLLVRADSAITADSEDALCGLTLSAQLGSAEAKFADSIASRCQLAGKEPLEVKTFQEQAAVNLAVSEGRADAALGSTSQVVYVIDQIKGKFKAVELPWGPQNNTGIVLARNADTDQLAKAVEAANNKLIQDGTVQEILDKYNGGLGAVDKATIVPPLS